MHTKERQVTARSSDGREKLALYIYEYLVHIGARKAAQTFLSEIRWEKDIALGDPPGFLHSWWAIFWDLYCAAPERRDIYSSSSEAKAFYDYGFVNNYSSGPHNSESTNCRTTNTTEGAQMGPMPPTFAPNTPLRPPSLGPPRQPYPPAKTMRSPPFQGQCYPVNQRPILRRPRMGAEYNSSNQPSQSFQGMMSPKNYSDFNRPGPSGMSSRVGVPFNPSYVPNSRGPPPYSANVYPGPSGLNSTGQQQYQGSPGTPYYIPPRTYSGAPKPPPRPSLSTLPVPQDLTVSGSDSVFTPMRPVKDPTRTEEYANSPVYESSSVEQAKSSMADDCLGNEKSSPLSETNSPKDDNNRLSDFSMADYRRYLETDHSDSVAIMKIKESMQEEAKKFEKDSDSLTFVELQ